MKKNKDNDKHFLSFPEIRRLVSDMRDYEKKYEFTSNVLYWGETFPEAIVKGIVRNEAIPYHGICHWSLVKLAEEYGAIVKKDGKWIVSKPGQWEKLRMARKIYLSDLSFEDRKFLSEDI